MVGKPHGGTSVFLGIIWISPKYHLGNIWVVFTIFDMQCRNSQSHSFVRVDL